MCSVDRDVDGEVEHLEVDLLKVEGCELVVFANFLCELGSVNSEKKKMLIDFER